MKEEGAGILEWLVQGYLKWKRDGLAEPEVVSSATKAYRADEDHLGNFIQDCCHEVENGVAGATELFQAAKE